MTSYPDLLTINQAHCDRSNNKIHMNLKIYLQQRDQCALVINKIILKTILFLNNVTRLILHKYNKSCCWRRISNSALSKFKIKAAFEFQ